MMRIQMLEFWRAIVISNNDSDVAAHVQPV